ncbi:hypothetical protein LINGRAHAP2_LOCUS23215 [Linum grandiflorum]
MTNNKGKAGLPTARLFKKRKISPTTIILSSDSDSTDAERRERTPSVGRKTKKYMCTTPTSDIINIDDIKEVPGDNISPKLHYKFAMRFPLTEYMELKDAEVDMVYYIIVDGLPADEVLAENDMCFCDRKTLWSLLPGERVASSIITTLAHHLNQEQPWKLRLAAVDCFLPATLQSLVMNHGLAPEKAFNYYGDNFLLQAHRSTKVFLPMIDEDDHCYLVVILMKENVVDMVDSLPRDERLFFRQSDIRTMMKFMSQVFKIMYASRKLDGEVPNVDAFPIVIPEDVPRQQNLFDCGMWVCNWMLQAIEFLPNIYSLWLPTNLDRMKLALMLVKGPHNKVWEMLQGKIEEHANIRRRAINGFLLGINTETASDRMKYTDKDGARRKLLFEN